MAKHMFVALSVPQPGREEELEQWYDTQHMQDVLKLDGFVSAQRFRIDAGPQGANLPAWKLMGLYEIETDDIAATMGQIAKVARTPAMPLSDAFDPATSCRIVAAAASARFTKDGR